MSDKRQNYYTITSQRDLLAFFSDTLPKAVIRKTIQQMKRKFVQRPGSARFTKKMQFLKKCEWELVRLAKKALAEKKKREMQL